MTPDLRARFLEAIDEYLAARIPFARFVDAVTTLHAEWVEAGGDGADSDTFFDETYEAADLCAAYASTSSDSGRYDARLRGWLARQLERYRRGESDFASHGLTFNA